MPRTEQDDKRKQELEVQLDTVQDRIVKLTSPQKGKITDFSLAEIKELEELYEQQEELKTEIRSICER